MSYATLVQMYLPLLKEAKRRGGSGIVHIIDEVKCAPCGKQVVVKGVRTWIRKKRKVIEFYEGECKHCGAVTKVEWEKKDRMKEEVLNDH